MLANIVLVTVAHGGRKQRASEQEPVLSVGNAASEDRANCNVESMQRYGLDYNSYNVLL